jgi:hypothetical protein
MSIQDLVRRGYLVRTRADADTIEAPHRRHDAALLAGAQFASTDDRVPGRAAPFSTDYLARSQTAIPRAATRSTSESTSERPVIGNMPGMARERAIADTMTYGQGRENAHVGP